MGDCGLYISNSLHLFDTTLGKNAHSRKVFLPVPTYQMPHPQSKFPSHPPNPKAQVLAYCEHIEYCLHPSPLKSAFFYASPCGEMPRQAHQGHDAHTLRSVLYAHHSGKIPFPCQMKNAGIQSAGIPHPPIFYRHPP